MDRGVSVRARKTSQVLCVLPVVLGFWGAGDAGFGCVPRVARTHARALGWVGDTGGKGLEGWCEGWVGGRGRAIREALG